MAAFPVFVEEQPEVTGFAVHYPVSEQFYEISEPLFEFRRLPYAVKCSVWFEDVQVRVHCLALIDILVAQPHVPDFAPVFGECLEITVLYGVEAVFLYVVEQLYGIFKCLRIPCRPAIFAEPVDCESEGINLLFSVGRLFLRSEAPVNSAEFPVIEPVDDFPFGPCRRFKIFRPAEDAVCSGECPQYPCVQYGSLASVAVFFPFS